MTPIKNVVQNLSGTTNGSNFAVKFRIQNLAVTTTAFKLVSAVNQIPQGIDVRPRKSKEKTPKGNTTPVSSDMELSSPPTLTPESLVTKPSKATPAATNFTKRRALNEVVGDEELFIHVKVRGDLQHRGFINIQKGANLKVFLWNFFLIFSLLEMSCQSLIIIRNIIDFGMKK
jgi:hypothetical protein